MTAAIGSRPTEPNLGRANGLCLADGEIPAPTTPKLANGVTDDVPSPVLTDGHILNAFELDSKYAYTPRKMRVITIGAGFSGLLMAHKFHHRFPDMRDIVDHTIFEARSDIGGTWCSYSTSITVVPLLTTY